MIIVRVPKLGKTMLQSKNMVVANEINKKLGYKERFYHPTKKRKHTPYIHIDRVLKLDEFEIFRKGIFEAENKKSVFSGFNGCLLTGYNLRIF